MKTEYWTETQWEFLKKCCDGNLKQYSIPVPDGDDGYYQFHEVVFEIIPYSGCVITAKNAAGSVICELPSEFFRENHHIMLKWVKRLMRTVYDNWLTMKKYDEKLR